MNPVFLHARSEFPDPRAISSGDGLVAVGGDLSIERLLLAYRSGIFPWSAQPLTWWSPDPRAIFEFNRFHISRSLAKILRRCLLVDMPTENSISDPGFKPLFQITINRAFRAVMEGCATTRQRGNWISSSFIDAYTKLHEAGHAHSVECWRNGQLAGGIYGVATGGFFAGESMFHRESNASKVALCFLFQRLRERGFVLFDIQMLTPTTEKFGAVEISRDDYLSRLSDALKMSVTFC